MLWINLLFLMFAVLVPFSTALVHKHYAQPSAIRIYACNLIAVGLALEFLWVYGYKNKLMKPPVNSDYLTRGEIRNMVPPICLSACACAFVFAGLGLEQFAYMPVHTDHLCRIRGSNKSKAAGRKKKGASR
jgi:uncharacterized membrane protein